MRRKLVGEDCDEDEIVDAEDDFQNDKGCEADPEVWICKEFHGGTYQILSGEREKPRTEDPRQTPHELQAMK
ncbi:hypothetical protein [Mesorhizobium sp. Cs1299R1N3]|uniref:hypothetical protein n=1 Tax=Mesorhizobium sp. Cs1299R1N3 TaxID=3015173 RepID=UPI00301C8A92